MQLNDRSVYFIRNKGGFNFYIKEVKRVTFPSQVMVKGTTITTVDHDVEFQYYQSIKQILRPLNLDDQKVEQFIGKILELKPLSLHGVIQIANSYTMKLSNTNLEKIVDVFS